MTSSIAKSTDRGAWRRFPHGWRQLYGDFDRLGVSLEWHDFTTKQPIDWGQSFRPRSVEFCLNVEGRGAVGDRMPADYTPGSAGYYALTGSTVARFAPGAGSSSVRHPGVFARTFAEAVGRLRGGSRAGFALGCFSRRKAVQ